MNKLFCSAVAAGLMLSAAAAAERPAYCSGSGTDKLPECGWTAEKENASPRAREEQQKPTEAEIREMARVYANCMKTDTSADQCARKIGLPPGMFR